MQDMFMQIHNANNTAHSDQTGCFPVTSSSGNKYIMVLVEVDRNFIDAEPMKKSNSTINYQSLPGIVEAPNSKWNGKTNNTLVRQ